MIATISAGEDRVKFVFTTSAMNKLKNISILHPHQDDLSNTMNKLTSWAARSSSWAERAS